METETEVAAVEIAFDERGLVACITQDWATGEVLTLAYMNREALERTLASGEIHFWSRSRDELWRKGETSGNVQRLRSIRYDCDADALLALVEPAGPDRKSTRLNSSHLVISYAVFCLKKKNTNTSDVAPHHR